MLKFRVGGKQRWHTIGRHGSPWTPEQARKEARRILGELAIGKNPRGEARATVARRGRGIHRSPLPTPAFGRPDRMVAAQVRRRPMGDQESRIDRAQRRVALLREVQGDDRTKRTYIANRVRAALSRFFKWAISEALIPSRENPVAGTEPRRGEMKRERVLTDEEIRKVWTAANDCPFGAIVRLLLATGQRRGEVGGMRWSELDLEGRTWRMPPERSKGGREHLVPLNDLALEILEACPRVEGRDCIFSMRRESSRVGAGEKPARR